MSRVRVHNFSVSLDGFGSGEGQSLDAPFGHAGTRLHEWFFATRSFHAMQGQPGGSGGVDDAFASAWGPGIGAEIMGRNKFGPQRGPWADHEWQGWWGDNPPFHTPVFVLTHHPRPLRRWMAAPRSTSPAPAPPRPFSRHDRPQPGWTSGLAAAQLPSAPSWPLT